MFKVLDAVSLEERFKKALPMLTRQIEGLKLLQKTRKMSPDNENRVETAAFVFFFNECVSCVNPVHACGCCRFRFYQCVKAGCSQDGSSIWMGTMKMKMEMTQQSWRGRCTVPTCLKPHSKSALKNLRGKRSSQLS